VPRSRTCGSIPS